VLPPCPQVFPYPLDDFQKEALQKLLDGMSVVVCAPTGAGKTAIAEAAAAATLARGLRVVYTTPLKVGRRGLSTCQEPLAAHAKTLLHHMPRRQLAFFSMK